MPPKTAEPVRSVETASGSATATEQAFQWGVGIECSFLPHIDVDQFDWTQHNRFWRDDLKMIRQELGVSHLRYALPWHVLESKRGTFDWSMADERIEYCRELGIELSLDVMHFGTPTWLRQAVGDPHFPEAIESFTEAMVSRYRDAVSTWCPFNEPLVSALFSGDFGFWPPYARKWRGYMPVLSRIVQGVHRAIAAIRRVQPQATVLLCDAMENFQSRAPELQAEVQLRNLRRFIVLDLLGGRVDHHHPLFSWLTSFGFSELDLAYFQSSPPQLPDVIGLDYYPHSDWQLESHNGVIRQRRADAPLGIYELARATYDRYALPMMVTETSVEGPPISREVWLQTMTDQIRELREAGIPLLGLFWWPLFDQIDWDGALTHRIGKLHRVGLFSLNRQADGTLKRSPTPLAKVFRDIAAGENEHVGTLAELAIPAHPDDGQLAPLLSDASQWQVGIAPPAQARWHPGGNGHNGNGNGNGHAGSATVARRLQDEQPVAGLSGEPQLAEQVIEGARAGSQKSTDRYGIVVFSHLRWGFVWQRPQQFLSRFAKFHPVLFVEEPFFDLPAGAVPRLDLHRVMPNITVVCAHCPPETQRDPKLSHMLRQWVREALSAVNQRGEFDQPLLWYYSPMDSLWSLGHFANRGIVYDCMDELSQFTGAPPELIDNEQRLMDCADVVFTGGYELWTKKSAVHANAHFYGCGVEFEHFNQADNPSTAIPPDIDFLNRPVLGWFGVIDERVNYPLLAEIARQRPDWSIAMVGPVVKIDPNLLPHAPNLHWLGQRTYEVLPNYCRAFDVCIMAFAINKATEFINPTKALEYLATGRPVVSTAVKDVVRQYSDLVEIAATPAEFIAAVEQVLTHRDEAKIRAGLELARSKSWENNVAQMRANIKEAISADQRRSARAKPAADPGPGYFFRHTQGS